MPRGVAALAPDVDGLGAQHPAEPAPARSALDPDVVGRLLSLGDAAGEDLFGQLTEIFLAELPGRLERLRSAIAEDDPDARRRAAHTLRGSSANVGAAALAALCAQVEEGGGDTAVLLADVELEAVRVGAALVETASSR